MGVFGGLVTTATRAGKQIGLSLADQVKAGFPKFQERVVEYQTLLDDLATRRMRAEGDDIGADRRALAAALDRARGAAINRFGSASTPLLQEMQATYEAELAAINRRPIEEAKKRAQAIRAETDPWGGFSEQMAHLEELRRQFPDIIDDKVFGEKAARIRADLQRMLDSADTFGNRMKNTVEGFSSSASDAFADMVVDGTASFEALAKSWAKTMISMAMQAAVFGPLFKGLGSFLGSSMGGVPSPPLHGPPLPDDISVRVGRKFALGGVLTGPVVFPTRSGVVTKRTRFPMANGGVGEMGEAGPEAIMPLEWFGGGKLGVNARGAGTIVNIIDQRQSGQAVTAQERTGPDGRRVLDVYIRDAVRGMIDSGGLDRSLATSFGLSRAARPR